jgi:hypothetical protein
MVFSLWSVHGLYSSDVSRQSVQLVKDSSSYELRVKATVWLKTVSDGRGCQKNCSCSSEL